MDITPIKSQRDYRRILKEIEGLMHSERNTPGGDRLDALVTLVEAWEAKHDRRGTVDTTAQRAGRKDRATASGRQQIDGRNARAAAEIRIRAVAFQEGDVWVVQGIEYDIAAHASDPTKVPAAFAKALLHNAAISKHLGRRPFEGIKPAPRRYRQMFDRALTEVRAVDRAQDDAPSLIGGIDIRLAEPA